MKKLIVLAGIALASQFALAADKAPTAQQQLMGTCNTEAKTKELKKALKSDDVRDYINKNYKGAVVPVF